MISRMNLSSRFASQSAESMREQYGITHQDLARIQAFAVHVEPRMDDMVDNWYDWLRTQPEFEQYFSESDTLHRVQGLQHSYWQIFMSGTVDDAYVERRRRVGEAHARIGLPLNTYFAGMNRFLDCFREVAIAAEMSESDRLATQYSVTKLLHLDTAIVVDTYNAMVEETLTAQANSLLEMSTPVTHIWDGILLLPIVGLIDSRRARDVMNATLEKIAESQARIFILDISGVGVVDTAVANHLIKISRATRLMGCECVISGISPAIAQTVVDLGIDVGDVKTTATMKDALATAFSQLGLSIADAS
jgi:rsbT co-antagonist protein RsbR